MIYAYIRNLLSFAFLTLVLSGQNALVLSKPQVVSLVSSASDPSMKNLEKITEGTNAEELRQILRVLFPSIKAVIGKREEVCKKWLITYKVFWLQFIKVSEAFHKAGTRAGNQGALFVDSDPTDNLFFLRLIDENEYAEEKRLCLELKLRALLYTDKIQENLVTRTKATYELEPVPIDQLEAGLKTARYRLPESPKRKLSTAFFEFTNAMRAFAILFETFSKLQVIPIATRNLTDTTKPPLDPMVQEAKNLPKRVVVDSLNTNALIQLRVHHCVEWAMETKVLHESDPCEKILKRIEGGKSKDVVEAVMELFPSASAKRIGEIIVHFEFYAFYWLVFYTNRLYLDNPKDQPYPYGK